MTYYDRQHSRALALLAANAQRTGPEYQSDDPRLLMPIAQYAPPIAPENVKLREVCAWTGCDTLIEDGNPGPSCRHCTSDEGDGNIGFWGFVRAMFGGAGTTDERDDSFAAATGFDDPLLLPRVIVGVIAILLLLCLVGILATVCGVGPVQ